MESRSYATTLAAHRFDSVTLLPGGNVSRQGNANAEKPETPGCGLLDRVSKGIELRRIPEVSRPYPDEPSDHGRHTHGEFPCVKNDPTGQ
jgi:hypothetical protein